MNQPLRIKLGVLASVYLSQQLAFGFLLSALPVYLRSTGVSLQAIGALSALGIPWILKFLWSPLVDGYRWTQFGHYKSWIFLLQSSLVLVVLRLSYLEINENFLEILVGAGLISFLSATIDIASDGLAIEMLEPQERGLGNGVQLAGTFTGSILGGGGLLILLDHWGWQSSIQLLGFFCGVLLLPILLYPEKSLIRPSEIPWHSLISFVRRPGMGRWMLILIPYMSSYTLTITMFRPLLVDLGFTLETIGLITGIIGTLGGIPGAIVAGSLIQVLGRKRSMTCFMLLQIIGILAHYIVLAGFTFLPVIAGVNILFIGLVAMSSTAAGTVIMDYSRPESAATDSTFQKSLMFLGALPAGALSGVIAESFGYGTVFAVGSLISLGLAGLIWKFYEEPINQK